jgi:iron complex outermembrane recepter protein
VTWVYTDIKEFTGFTAAGVQENFAGQQFNLTPKWSGDADATYTWPVRNTTEAFVGVGLTARSRTTGVIGESNNPDFNIDAYTNFDAQIGLRAEDDQWNLRVFGSNLTNKYSWNNVNRIGDVVARVANPPRLIGAGFNYRF